MDFLGHITPSPNSYHSDVKKLSRGFLFGGHRDVLTNLRKVNNTALKIHLLLLKLKDIHNYFFLLSLFRCVHASL